VPPPGETITHDCSAPSPWLSVIMPIRCGEETIDVTMRSLAAECDNGVEILVFDSSPTSATLDIVRKYADCLRLRIIEDHNCTTWPTKTNYGVELANAQHVCWLHSDDLWLPGRVAAVRSWIETDPGASLHLAPSVIVDRNGRNLGLWRCPLPDESELSSSFVTERLLVQNFISAPAPVFRKDAWLACGGIDDALWYTGDWDIWLKLVARGPVRYHDAVTTAFRIHSSSMTITGSRDITDFAQQLQIVLDRHLITLKARSIAVERVSRASISINTALAAASAGDYSRLMSAAYDMLRLGPTGLRRYFRDSRILERVTSRLRAKLGGGF